MTRRQVSALRWERTVPPGAVEITVSRPHLAAAPRTRDAAVVGAVAVLLGCLAAAAGPAGGDVPSGEAPMIRSAFLVLVLGGLAWAGALVSRPGGRISGTPRSPGRVRTARARVALLLALGSALALEAAVVGLVVVGQTRSVVIGVVAAGIWTVLLCLDTAVRALRDRRSAAR